MFGWVASGLLIVAGFVASRVVAKDAPQFGLVQMVVAKLLLIPVVGIPARTLDPRLESTS
jgi:hypothetical protein